MKKIYITLIILLTFNITKAQYVTIPDTIFAAYLNAVLPFGMVGNQMDTTSIYVTSCSDIDVSLLSISSLEGVQYFDNLQYLFCGENNLTSLPPLPASLYELECHSNLLTSLPVLPNSLYYLYCGANQLTSIPTLPNSLAYFDCTFNPLTNLPSLPASLISLGCYNDNLTSLPVLPNSLQTLNCGSNPLYSLPTLPASLTALYCIGASLTSMPALPNSIEELDCSQNPLTSLPTLPNSLQQLYCNYDPFITLPALPNSLLGLDCYNSNLKSLPTLPSSLVRLYCMDNDISCFPIFPNSIISSVFSIYGNPFTCLPNYISAMDSTTLTFPLCITGDTVINPKYCTCANGIAGFTFNDVNTNCLKDTLDIHLPNIHEMFYDGVGNLIGQTYSLMNGIYDFPILTGTYISKIDTAGMPYQIQCPNPGVDSSVILTNIIPLAKDVNFNIECKPGFDIGVQSIVPSGLVFPGWQHILKIRAGDLSQSYNLNCAAGISGQVQVTINGPVTYNGIALGALTPVIAGNIYTYNITDFGTINNTNAFGLIFNTDTSAQAGDTICVDVTISPSVGDNNSANNIFSYCYIVANSYDPNSKEVYPIDVLPGYNDYFTYTIHFQNTGTAPAQNIRIVDTLSTNFNLETFQMINYSHYNIVSLVDNILTVRFPNIQLPDSISNLEASKGFLQYRVKPIVGLSNGTQIHNNAFIYFDYNSPIPTNTTTNLFTFFVNINEDELNSSFFIFPNPTTNNLTIETSPKSQIEILNIQGQILKRFTTNDSQTTIDLSNIPSGIYFIKAKSDKGITVKKFMKE